MLPEIVRYNPNATMIQVGSKRYFFSYQTCVAFSDWKTGTEVRIDQFFSKTTSRHLTLMGVKEYQAIPEEDFLQFVG